jgi:predicted DNA-binding protein
MHAKSSGGNGYEEQIAVRLPAKTVAALRDLARRNDRTMAQELRRAIRRHIDAEHDTA